MNTDLKKVIERATWIQGERCSKWREQRCQGPEMGLCLEGLRPRKEARGTGAGLARGRMEVIRRPDYVGSLSLVGVGEAGGSTGTDAWCSERWMMVAWTDVRQIS